jgi:L-asparagine transporter-like permease
MIKLATIIGFILIGAALLTSGRAVPQYNAQGGFFPAGFWAPVVALTYAIYSFGGVEMVAVTTGESRATKDIPRAVWMTFLTLTVVYVGAIVILLGVMPWNHAGVSESPFVTTFRTVRIPHASGLMNFVVLTAALSGANATLYVASRMVFSLARTGWAPASLGRLNHEGSPQNAVLHSSFGILLALALVLFVPQNAFRYMLGAAFTGMILSWLVSLAAHISFRHRRSPAELAKLPLRSPLGIWGSVFGFLAVTVSLLQTWLHPLHRPVNLWSGLTLIGVLTLAFIVLKRQPLKGRTSNT